MPTLQPGDSLKSVLRDLEFYIEGMAGRPDHAPLEALYDKLRAISRDPGQLVAATVDLGRELTGGGDGAIPTVEVAADGLRIFIPNA